ncbi:MAG: glycosyltransferase family 4 protein [Acinetobacter sp.]
MKIWLMNHYATSMFRDKAGRHYWFAKELEKREHDVTVFCASTYLNNDKSVDMHGKRFITQYDDKTQFVFVKTTPYSGNGRDRVKNMASFFFGLLKTTEHYIKQAAKPDVIIASSVHPLTMVAGIRIAKRLEVPCICEVRDLWPEAIFTFGKAGEKSLLGRLLVAGEHWIYRKADALVFTKEGDTDYLKEHGWTTEQGGDIGMEKCYYINNGVNLKGYQEQSTTEILDDADLLDESKFNVIYTGTVRPVNNVDNMLDCAKLLKGKICYNNVQFLIYGDGSETEKLRRRVTDEALENVKLKGFVARKYMPYVLSKSAVNILNYSQNQFNWTRGNSSNKLFEYMASGKPIISTVRMGYSIINKYHCGIELDKCTPEALTEAIMHFHDMTPAERQRYGRNAAEGVKNFDFDTLTDKLMGVIESVTA